MFSLQYLARQTGNIVYKTIFKICIDKQRECLVACRRQMSVKQCVTIELDSNVYRRYRIEECPELNATLSRKQARCYYRQMFLIRRMEQELGQLYRTKLVRGFCHLYTGQEACCVGQVGAMYEDDCTITAYRCHGWGIQYGITPTELIGELMGKVSGICRGKGGSMHIYAKNFFGGNGIVGAQVPLGAGIALALKYLKKNAVCLALYGDGAANQGQVFEAYNMACLWKLPCIFVCENNLYAMGTADNRGSCNTEYYTRGDLLPGIWVDGMNVLAVRNATEFARNYALTCGPIVMELNTYRYFGHSMSDPDITYRKRDEIQDVRQKRDPIVMFKTLVLDNCLLTEDDLKCIEDETKKTVSEALAKSKNEKEAGMEDLAGDVYFENLEPKIRDIYAYTIDHKCIATRYEYRPEPTPKDQITLPPPPAKNEKDKKPADAKPADAKPADANPAPAKK